MDDGIVAADIMSQSTYRAHHYALTGVVGDFESLSADDQEKWNRFAVWWSNHWRDFDGGSFPEVAQVMYQRFNPDATDFSGQLALEWQIIVRHMHRLVDAWEEVSGDLSDQEQFWRGWFEERLNRVGLTLPAAQPSLQTAGQEIG